MTGKRIAFVASDSEEAQSALAALRARYGEIPQADAEVVVALGGDGFMLETLHSVLDKDIPIYGMNRGTVGFLMNGYAEKDLPARIARAEEVALNPLRMIAHCQDGRTVQALAINEVSLLRETRQAALLRITVDGVVRIEEMVCDGVLLATPAGSTAYNLSAHGPIIPIGARLLALTPISVFRPRRWRGALLPDTAKVVIEVIDPKKRPASATADYTEVREVTRVEIFEDKTASVKLLFDPEHNLEQRILGEQFSP